MDKIKRFFECLIPVTVCNLECDYCYIIQHKQRHMNMAKLQYEPKHIAQALRKERVGGVCYFSICGAGETLIQNEVIEIVKLLLEEGHYVNITTNGTLSNQINKLISQCDNKEHLHMAFSLHYLELKRRDLLDTFFQNVEKVSKAGISYLVQMNLYDGYLSHLDEIKEICMEKVGAYPQIAVTRDEHSFPIKMHTDLSADEYYRYGAGFDSKLFEITFQNFNVKRSEFCYAGDWTGVLNLANGWLQKCYQNKEGQNIFENIDKPIRFSAVGKYCNNAYCVNSSHFMSLGVIPSIETPTYAELRDRENAGWYNEEMKHFLNSKLQESNQEYSNYKKFRSNTLSLFYRTKRYIRRFAEKNLPNRVKKLLLKQDIAR